MSDDAVERLDAVLARLERYVVKSVEDTHGRQHDELGRYTGSGGDSKISLTNVDGGGRLSTGGDTGGQTGESAMDAYKIGRARVKRDGAALQVSEKTFDEVKAHHGGDESRDWFVEFDGKTYEVTGYGDRFKADGYLQRYLYVNLAGATTPAAPTHREAVPPTAVGLRGEEREQAIQDWRDDNDEFEPPARARPSPEDVEDARRVRDEGREKMKARREMVAAFLRAAFAGAEKLPKRPQETFYKEFSQIREAVGLTELLVFTDASRRSEDVKTVGGRYIVSYRPRHSNADSDYYSLSEEQYQSLLRSAVDTGREIAPLTDWLKQHGYQVD